MKILPKTEKEALNIVYNILNQGDNRYNDPENEFILSKFIMENTISLEKEEFPNLKEPTDEELGFLFEIQLYEKYIGKILLKEQGFKDNKIFFERRFQGSQPDILAKKEDKTIVVECCSCRISKIVDFLFEADEVWIITRGMPPREKIPYIEDKMEWFIFKKGSNWSKVIEFKQNQLEQLKKVKSPLDRL